MDYLIRQEDAISAIKQYCKGCDNYNGVRCKSCDFDYAMNAIYDCKTVDAEPVRHGRWIFKVYDERINYRWNVKAYCSECCDEEQEIWAGFFPGVPDFMAHDIALNDAKTVKLPNYCQTCGAKMDAEVIDHGSNPTEHGH